MFLVRFFFQVNVIFRSQSRADTSPDDARLEVPAQLRPVRLAGRPQRCYDVTVSRQGASLRERGEGGVEPADIGSHAHLQTRVCLFFYLLFLICWYF